jgi:UDP-N-acetylglucosamine--N-acetylmuramyl-(pentapeptide) pyrophosphoryl-undecaprenol N-acetylglucosamine transferase
MKRAMILAGGTGGHIYPGIAVAEALKAQSVEVSWMGSQAKMAMEKELVPDYFELHTIAVYQLRGKGLLAKLFLPFQLCNAVWQAVKVLKRVKPNVCVAFGGFVAGPGGIAAKLLGIPLVVHEQNARAGLTNRYLAKVAKRVLQAFPDSFPTKIDAITVGNPVRKDILELPEPEQRLQDHTGPLRVLVLGGSLGAKAINEAMVEWLKTFNRIDEITVRHQTGKAHAESMQQLYTANNIKVDATAYINDMPQALSWTDVVICRAGALTVSELSDVGIAAIFIPMPWAVDNHQFYNAQYLASQSAATIVEQKDLSPQKLSETIESYLDNRAAILEVSKKARSLAMRNACDEILSNINHSCANTVIEVSDN